MGKEETGLDGPNKQYYTMTIWHNLRGNTFVAVGSSGTFLTAEY